MDTSIGNGAYLYFWVIYIFQYLPSPIPCSSKQAALEWRIVTPPHESIHPNMTSNPYSKLSGTGADFVKTSHTDTYEYIKPEQFDLKGRAVLITGASKGIGRATAISYAKAGASYIALAARTDMQDVEAEMLRAAKAAGKSPPHVLRLTLDVTSQQSVEAAMAEVSKAFGRLDILINNAGYLKKFELTHEEDVDAWWKTWEINIKGVFLATRAALPLLLQADDGLKTILNMSSVGAHIVSPGASAYQCSKLALLRMGEFLNEEYKDSGVLAFGVHPGGVLTELGKGLPQEMHSVLTDTSELAGDSVVWLTAERREWLRGRYVSCKWDMEEFLGKREVVEKGDLLKVRLDVGLS